MVAGDKKGQKHAPRLVTVCVYVHAACEDHSSLAQRITRRW